MLDHRQRPDYAIHIDGVYQGNSLVNKRLNITLPEETIRLMDRVAGKGLRRNLIDRAVRRYVRGQSRANLRKQLAASYRANADEELQLAEDWFPALGEASWRIALGNDEAG